MASTPPGPFERCAPESADHRCARRAAASIWDALDEGAVLHRTSLNPTLPRALAQLYHLGTWTATTIPAAPTRQQDARTRSV